MMQFGIIRAFLFVISFLVFGSAHAQSTDTAHLYDPKAVIGVAGVYVLIKPLRKMCNLIRC